MPIYDDVTKLIGNTPLVRINRLTDGAERDRRGQARVLQPGQPRSRTASASRSSTPPSAPASSSPAAPSSRRPRGNTGIALAMVGAARGYKVVLTMPETMSKERRALLRAFGAELVLTPGPEGMKGAVSQGRGDRRRARAPSWPASSPTRPTRRSTARPRRRRSGTTPTARSTSSSPASAPAAPSPASARCSRRASPSVQIIAVEPAESPILNGGQPGPHKIQGIGANFVPEILDTTIYDEVIDVNAETSVAVGPPGRHGGGPARRHLLRCRARRRRPGRPATRERRQADRRHHPVVRRALPLHDPLRGSGRLRPQLEGPAIRDALHL